MKMKMMKTTVRSVPDGSDKNMRFDRWEKLWDYPLIIVVVDQQHHHPDNDHILLQGWAARVKKTKEQTITGLPIGLS